MPIKGKGLRCHHWRVISRLVRLAAGMPGENFLMVWLAGRKFSEASLGDMLWKKKFFTNLAWGLPVIKKIFSLSGYGGDGNTERF